MIKLLKPDIKYFEQYKEMMDEWNMEGSRISPWPLHLKYHTKEYFEEMLKRVEDVENGINLDGYASSTTFWLYDDEANKILGASNLRHYLTEDGLKTWGHIGYGIRPSERRKGYATVLLKLTLEEAKKIGIGRVLLGAYTGNIGSWKVMEKCGGEFENIVIEEETSLPIKRYWISLKKRFATNPNKMEIVQNGDLKIMEFNDSDFKGDIALINFKKMYKPYMIKNINICMANDNYKWVEFYDYTKKYRLTAMYNEKNEIVEWYFDIARKIGKENGIPYEDDLYLDVVLRPDGTTILLDEDELKDAFDRKEMTKEEYDEAYKIATDLIERINGKAEEMKEFTNKYLNIMLEL